MDRGFYKRANINGMFKEHLKFLIGVKTSLIFFREALDNVYDDIRNFRNYNPNHDVYGCTVLSEWIYEQERPSKGDVQKKRRIYFNLGKAAEGEREVDKLYATLQNELLCDERVENSKKQYETFFNVKRTPKRDIQVTANAIAMKEAKRYYGFFALLSNEKMDAITALELYRTKDVVEKAFGNLKEQLNLRRTLVSSEQDLNGKLFVEFVALIYLSYMHRRMQEHSLLRIRERIWSWARYLISRKNFITALVPNHRLSA